MPLFESAGSKFSSGDYKGMTAFAHLPRKPDYPPYAGKKRGALW